MGMLVIKMTRGAGGLNKKNPGIVFSLLRTGNEIAGKNRDIFYVRNTDGKT
jgi:hypothetical protein